MTHQHDPPSAGHGHGHGLGHGHQDTDDAALAELLDLDAEVLHAHLTEVVDWIDTSVTNRRPRRILDLGSGTGTGVLALLERFADAYGIAVDSSAAMLYRLTIKAQRLGIDDRVRTVQTDLDVAWPDIDDVDLVWASASLHHLEDPDRVLDQVFAALRPSGLLSVIELDSFPRFLPEDIGIGRPGLEGRCHAALADGQSQELPYLGSDWGPRLTRAGFALEGERTFAIQLRPPLPVATGRYAEASLQRIRPNLGDRIGADDLEALDALLDSTRSLSILRRDDLTVRTTRTVWIARRP